VQAGLLPIPELLATVDNFGCSGANRGFDASESALRLMQLVELGGKRDRRRAVAGLERDAAQWDYEVRRAGVLAATRKAFVAVLALQERSALAAREVGLAEESARAVDAQVRAGAGAPAEALRARVAISQSDLARMARERELATARVALAAVWGSSSPTFERAAGTLDAITLPPPLDALLTGVDANPDLARWTTELAARDAAIALEEARAVPDITVGAGPSYYADAGGAGVVLDFSVPLPLFNRNQGAIDAARAQRLQADAARRAADTDVRAALARVHAAAVDAYRRAGRLRNDMLPDAQAAYARTRDAYQPAPCAPSTCWTRSAPCSVCAISTSRRSPPTTRRCATWNASPAPRSLWETCNELPPAKQPPGTARSSRGTTTEVDAEGSLVIRPSCRAGCAGW
jgi:cobalt-zinc-cadmium efflux system outer membrane protein